MSSNLNPRSSKQSFNVGNVVSSSLIIYRSHLKLYLGLAFKALLWAFIPVYGWAKYSVISAQISRLAFTELNNQPESAKDSYSQISPKMWGFLGAGILVSLILFGVNIGTSMISGVINIIFGGLVRAILPAEASTVLAGFLQLIINIVAFAVQLWIQSRLFIVELPLAMESNLDAATTITRSWNLTKGSVVSIQLTLLVGYLITLPLAGVAFIPLIGLIPFFASSPSRDSIISFVIFTVLIMIALIVLVGVLLMPLWQSIKAVIYYELRQQREGLGLQLRDRTGDS